MRCAQANGHPMRQVLRLDPTGSRSPTNRAPFVAGHSWRTPQSFGDLHRAILPERTVTALHRGVPVVCHLCVNCRHTLAFPSQIPPDSRRHVELTSRPSRSGTSTTKKWPIGVHRDCDFECLTPCEQRQQPMRPPRVAVRPQSLDVLDCQLRSSREVTALGRMVGLIWRKRAKRVRGRSASCGGGPERVRVLGVKAFR